ncbi:MAG TPA: hypothetical protein VHO24_13035 [Opitutaceae bacterium]|nr:hypothetical protein [Opitutaceae bacterium]
MKKSNSLLAAFSLLAAVSSVFAAPQVTTGAGAAPADIQAAVDAFRAKLGANNGAVAGPLAGGFRNINWDGVADTVSRPFLMPAGFFNSTTPRGAVFNSPGAGVTNSAKIGNPTLTVVRFGDIDPSYTTSFRTFTAERLFSPIGSTVVDTTFFVPSSPAVAATVNAFGVVFCDVDIAGSSTIEFFASSGASLGKFAAPVANNGLSFVGVFFDAGERAARVQVTHGTAVLGAGVIDNVGAGADVVVADDYMYSEPLPVAINGGMISASSSRGRVGTGQDVLINGFIVEGTQPRVVLVRGVGPTLANFGLPNGTLANPTVTIVDSKGAVVGSNDDWGNNAALSQAAAIAGAFPLAANSADAAVLVVLNPGPYTVVVNGVNGGTGTALVEVYEVKMK